MSRDEPPRWDPRRRRWESPHAPRTTPRRGWTKADRRPLSPSERQQLALALSQEPQAAFAARAGVARVTLWRALRGCPIVGQRRGAILSCLRAEGSPPAASPHN